MSASPAASGPPPPGWGAILAGVFRRFNDGNAMSVAAAAAFYWLLALFPGLAAVVSIYGVFGNPAGLAERLTALRDVVPSGALAIIENQVSALAAEGGQRLGLALAVSLLVALWSVTSGVKTLFDAMTFAYGETEQRGFLKYNLMTLGFAVGGLMLVALFLVMIAAIPALLALLPLGPVDEALLRFVRWPILAVAAFVALAGLYRYGPSHGAMPRRRVLLGAGFTTLAWLGASMMFSWYLSEFANYNATYGSLGAVAALMMWIWVSVLVVIVGAQLNAAVERARPWRGAPAGPG